MRKNVAYFAKVDKIEDIEGKDKIKYISLKDLGWQVISNVVDNPISVGDTVIYIEYDSYVKATFNVKVTPFEFLRKRTYSSGKDAFKVGMMKMAGLVSYGLIMPLSILDLYLPDWQKTNIDTITNLSEILGVSAIEDSEEAATEAKLTPFQKLLKKHMYFIYKYFAPKKVSYGFPSAIICTTDETRCENFPQYLYDNLQDVDVDITCKLDGQSLTAIVYKNMFYICSRNTTKYMAPIKKAAKEITKLKIDKFSNDFIAWACSVDLASKMLKHSKVIGDFVLQAELCGPGIQKNRMGFSKKEAKVFNLVTLEKSNRVYHNYDTILHNLIDMDLHSYIVPIVMQGKFTFKNKAELKEFAKGAYNNGFPREGLVIRAKDEQLLNSPNKGMHAQYSFKCINDDFAEKVGL